MLSDKVISWIRTAVPIAVGVLVTLLATKTGVVLDANTSAVLSAASVGVVGQAYYTAVRWLETKWPKWGWLLGSAKAPVYASPGDSVRVNGVTRQAGTTEVTE